MPFKSKAQMKAAFGGYLGSEMKSKAKQWASETPNISKLPNKKMKYENSKADKAKDKKMGVKENSAKDKAMDKKMKVHHAGKGTRARLNTAAEKNFFKSKLSK